jgi:dTDP-4-amino-4,6-dideoxy-D-glucose acyltransferase
MAFLTTEQIDKIGFAQVGKEVYISDKATFYNPSHISMGSHIRIDDFCIFSAGRGGIEIGDFVHITCYVSLIGEEKIKIGNFCGLSSKVAVFSSNDDYSGESLLGAKIIQEKHRNVTNKPVIFEDYTTVGAMSLILPGVTIGEGSVVGAFSFVRKSIKPWGIYFGNPLKFIKKRSKKMLEYIPEMKELLMNEKLKNYSDLTR